MTNIRKERHITTDPTDIKRIKKKYYEHGMHINLLILSGLLL